MNDELIEAQVISAPGQQVTFYVQPDDIVAFHP